MTPLFHLEQVKVYLGERFMLNIPHLDLFHDHLYFFTGPNGAGKSTLLKVLSLLLTPASGEILFQGQNVTRNQNKRNLMRRQVTYVEQSPYLFSGSVLYNLTYGLNIRGIRGVEQQHRVASALETVDMRGHVKCNVRELSGGEAQRVALARALAFKPKVLILDEPASNIDRQSRDKIERAISCLQGDEVSVLISTHDEQQLLRLKGEEIKVNDGRIISHHGATDQTIPFGPDQSYKLHSKAI